MLGSAGNSFNGSSSHHRRTQSEFTTPALMDLQPEVEEFVRSRSNNNVNYYGSRQTHQNTAVAHNYDYNSYNYDKHGSMGIKKFHKS